MVSDMDKPVGEAEELLKNIAKTLANTEIHNEGYNPGFVVDFGVVDGQRLALNIVLLSEEEANDLGEWDLDDEAGDEPERPTLSLVH